MASNSYGPRLRQVECRRSERVSRSGEAFDDGVRVSIYRSHPIGWDAPLARMASSFPSYKRKIHGRVLSDETSRSKSGSDSKPSEVNLERSSEDHITLSLETSRLPGYNVGKLLVLFDSVSNPQRSRGRRNPARATSTVTLSWQAEQFCNPAPTPRASHGLDRACGLVDMSSRSPHSR
jgi:hypothetical protein